ncbi:hypothetical protein BJ742DRAFT_742362 [Cladochytrium replicatum]|nr:hypothetical protein BJ742DRAFT_742362 [Cladochytrium replicatum]
MTLSSFNLRASLSAKQDRYDVVLRNLRKLMAQSSRAIPCRTYSVVLPTVSPVHNVDRIDFDIRHSLTGVIYEGSKSVNLLNGLTFADFIALWCPDLCINPSPPDSATIVNGQSFADFVALWLPHELHVVGNILDDDIDSPWPDTRRFQLPPRPPAYACAYTPSDEGYAEASVPIITTFEDGDLEIASATNPPPTRSCCSTAIASSAETSVIHDSKVEGQLPGVLLQVATDMTAAYMRNKDGEIDDPATSRSSDATTILARVTTEDAIIDHANGSDDERTEPADSEDCPSLPFPISTVMDIADRIWSVGVDFIGDGLLLLGDITGLLGRSMY